MRYAINSETSIRNIPADTEAVHLVRPIDSKKLKRLLRKCRNLEKITLSVSCAKRLSSKVKRFLKEKKIEFRIESNRGRAIDIPLKKLLRVVELRKDYQTLRDIEKVTGVPKSTVHYLVKYAERGKVKKGDETIYLK